MFVCVGVCVWVGVWVGVWVWVWVGVWVCVGVCTVEHPYKGSLIQGTYLLRIVPTVPAA